MKTNDERIARCCTSAQHLAKAFNIANSQQISLIAGAIIMAIHNGADDMQAHEEGRKAAADIAARNNAQTSIDQLLADLAGNNTVLVRHQALSHG